MFHHRHIGKSCKVCDLRLLLHVFVQYWTPQIISIGRKKNITTRQLPLYMPWIHYCSVMGSHMALRHATRILNILQLPQLHNQKQSTRVCFVINVSCRYTIRSLNHTETNCHRLCHCLLPRHFLGLAIIQIHSNAVQYMTELQIKLQELWKRKEYYVTACW